MAVGVSSERFFHVDPWSGWALARPAGPAIDLFRRGLSLALGGLPPPPLGHLAPPLAMPRGLAFDPSGLAIGVGENGQELCHWACQTEGADRSWMCDVNTPDCWRAAGFEGTPIADLAISRLGRLHLALPDRGEVLVLRLEPAGEVDRWAFGRPIAVAAAHGGAVYVLDAAVNEVVRVAPDGRFGTRWPLPFAADRLAVSSDDTLVVVEVGTSNVAFSVAGAPFVVRSGQRSLGPALAFEPAAEGGDRLLLLDAVTGRIVRYQVEADLIPLAWSEQSAPWSALGLRGGRPYGLIDPCVVQPVIFEADGFYQTRGTVLFGPFDAGEPEIEWHRVTAFVHPRLEGELRVDVEVLATEDPSTVDRNDDSPGGPWSAPLPLGAPRGEGHPAERALLGAVGRYAFLRLTLHGDGRRTPRLRWLRLELPRHSYLRFLPALYSEEPESRDLLGRLLSLFEAENADQGEAIQRLYTLFRPHSADPEWLPWLAARLDLLLEPSWPVETRRQVLAEAFQLYRRRGTRWALERYLTLYGGEGIRILESFQGRQNFILGTQSVLGCTTVLPGGCEPPRMELGRGIKLGSARIDSRPYVEAEVITEGRGELRLLVPERLALDPARLERVKAIAEQESPAGTVVHLVVARARARLGQLGRLGFDATLGGHGPWRLPLEGEGGGTGMLLARAPGTRGELELGRGVRLGMGAKI